VGEMDGERVKDFEFVPKDRHLLYPLLEDHPEFHPVSMEGPTADGGIKLGIN